MWFEVKLSETPLSPAITFAQTEESTSACVNGGENKTSPNFWTASQSHGLFSSLLFSFFFFYTEVQWCVCERERMNVVILMFMNCLLACAIFLFDGGIVTDCVRTDSCMSIISVTLLLFLFLLMENKLDWSSLHKSLSASRALFSTSGFQISVWRMNFWYFYVHVSTAVYSGHRGFKKRCSIMELGGGKTTWIFGDCKGTFIFSPNMPLYCNFHVCRFIFFHVKQLLWNFHTLYS